MMKSKPVPLEMYPGKVVFESSLCGLSKVPLCEDLKLASGPDDSADVFGQGIELDFITRVFKISSV